MKYLCLAYGDGEDWKHVPKSEQDALLAQDEVLRRRGDLVAAVQDPVTTLRAWDGNAKTTDGPFATSALPLAGCGIIEAENLEEAIQLIKDTPCARARGVVELRPILAINY